MADGPIDWNVALRSEDIGALEYLADRTAGDATLAVCRVGTSGYILKAQAFASCTRPEAVLAIAKPLVDALAELGTAGRPIELGMVSGTPPGGGTIIGVEPAVAYIGRGTGRAFPSVRAPDGSVVSPPFSRLAVERAALIETDEDVAFVLGLRNAGPLTWHSMYAILDVVKADVGGDKRIERRGWAPKGTIQRIRVTSCDRRLSGQGARHGVPSPSRRNMPIDELRGRYSISLRRAREVVQGVIAAWVTSRVAQGDGDTAGPTMTAVGA